jgi:nitrous-oxide reductase
MQNQFRIRMAIAAVVVMAILPAFFSGCGGPAVKTGALSGDEASRVYVKPGEYDEFYAFLSGGFSGQMSVYGIPSGRLLKVIPIFSVDPEKGYGFNEETKPLLNTSHGFIPGMTPTTRSCRKPMAKPTAAGASSTATIRRASRVLI